MNIKRVNIKRFGGISNFSLELKPGLNIIEGPNESGKSTTMAFIKSMLFGLGNKKGKDIRNNDRMRYSALDGSRGEGELLIEHNNSEIVINRSFGKTKKEDKVLIYDNLTGKELNYNKEVGETLLGINGETFENTLFIRQLGSKISKAKDDEIVMKITNIFENGDEGSNYERAVKSIDDNIKYLQSSRKTGYLDKLKLKLTKLMEERHEGLGLSENSIENEKRLIDLNERKQFINTELKKLELYRRHLKRAKLNKEYEEIKDYLVRSESLRKQQEEVCSDLKCNEGLITYDFIELIKADSDRYEIVESSILEKEELLNEISFKEKEIKEQVQNFDKFKELEPEMDLKVTKLLTEIQSLKEKILVAENIEKEKERLEEENIIKRRELGQGIKFEEDYEEIKNILQNYEEKLRSLKDSLENKKINRNKNYLNILSRKYSNMKLYIMISITLNILLFTLYYLFESFLWLGVFGVSILVTLLLIFNSSKLAVKKAEYELEYKEAKNREEEFKSITYLEKKLSDYGKKLNIDDYKKFLILFKRYEEYKKFKDVYEIRLQEKEEILRSYNLSVLRETFSSNKKVIDDLLEFTQSKSAEEFLEEYRQFKNIKESNYKYINSKENLEKEIIKLKEELIEIENRIRERCEGTSLRYVEMKDLNNRLSKIKNKLIEKEEIEKNLASINEGYKVLLKDRNIKELEEDISEMIEENVSYDYSNEEEIELQKNSYSKELIEVEKEIKDKENEIANRFIGKRTLFEIEEELEETKELININEKKLRALELTKDVLEKAFKEIQKNYGPVLNAKVSEYIRKFSLNKYYDAKVSENFELILKNKEEEMIPANYLSNGALDGVYLALRLGLIDLIFNENENITIFLDDAFVQYDDVRVEGIIEELYKISKTKQIILFTCHEREGRLSRKYKDVNIIRI